MRIHVSLLLASVCSLVLLIQPAVADERAQIKEKVEALMRESKQLKEAGKLDEAKAAHDKAEALIREIKGGEGERRETPAIAIGREQLERATQEIAKRREHAAELRKAGKVEDASRVEQEANALAEKLSHAAQELKRQAVAGERGERAENTKREQTRDRPEGRERAEGPRAEGVEQRVKHLLEAAEHLAAAGKGDLSQQLNREAHALRQGREVDQPRGEQPRGDRPRGDQPRGDRPRGDQPREGAPREGGQRDARSELHELREGMQRMHAEMEELRNLVRRLAERREER